VTTEEDPLDPTPVDGFRTTLNAIRYLEEAVSSASFTEGVVLRYGGFYGPGTSMSLKPEGEHVEMVRKRKFPIVGGGGGVWSFIHIDDAAAATLAAVEHGRPGIYNVVDDEPAPVREWLPELATALGARPPMRLPRWVGRILAGDAATVMMTEVRGASNAKAKRELGWEPRYASWRQGFANGLG
jgi:nucleoside-diphosphate-sugar epimerase